MQMSQKWKQEPHTFQTTLQKSKGKHIRIIPSNEGLLPILTKQLNLKFQQMETFTPFKSKDVDLHDVIPNSLLMVYIVAHRHAQDITSCLPKSPKMTRRDPLKTRKKHEIGPRRLPVITCRICIRQIHLEWCPEIWSHQIRHRIQPVTAAITALTSRGRGTVSGPQIYWREFTFTVSKHPLL